MEIIFWGCLFILFYIYSGYPFLLLLMKGVLGEKPIKNKEIFPNVTFIISAYNEAKVIRQKIENSLKQDYPNDKLEILVVSDASTDQTDQIVSEYENKGIKLVRMKERKGKTVGLNHAVSIATGEIIIFSDANAFYAHDAIRWLVRNFSDPSVGSVTGASLYIQKKESFVGWCESLYWNYDLKLKIIESQLGSMVGADGTIYAIRKKLYTPLEPQDINDFVNPLQIIKKGHRGVFEPKAVCYEKTVYFFEEEFRRKVRIVSRSLRGLAKFPSLLNPFKFGIFSLKLISHKLLRWFTPIFILGVGLSTIPLFNKEEIYQVAGVLQGAFYLLGAIGYLFSLAKINVKVFYIPYYFCLMNLASIFGIWKSFRGTAPIIWEPEREKGLEGSHKNFKFLLVLIGIILLIVFGFLMGIFQMMQFLPFQSITRFNEYLFWILIGLLVYSMILYPISLALPAMIIRLLGKSAKPKNLFFPSVTLLITAYNEEKVIRKKIENSLNLDYPKEKLSIVIASDGSTDKTNEIAESFKDKGVHVWAFPYRRGKISVINKSFERINSEIVVLSDANAYYEKESVRNLVMYFYDSSVGVASGQVSLINTFNLLGKPDRLYQRYENYIKRLETYIGSFTSVDGAMFAIRRNLYQSVPNEIILDDFVIAMNVLKQRKKIVFVPEAKGYEYATKTIKEAFHSKARVVAGAIQAIKLNIGLPPFNKPGILYEYFFHKFIRWIMPVLLAGIFILNLLLIEHGMYLTLFAAQVIFYFLGFIGLLTGISLRIFSLPLYFCVQNLGAAVGIWRGILDRQSVMWEKSERFIEDWDLGENIEK